MIRTIITALLVSATLQAASVRTSPRSAMSVTQHGSMSVAAGLRPVFRAPLLVDETAITGQAATFSRASTATQSVTDADCSTTMLSTVASGTLRIDCACDSSGERICGARVEPDATNLTLYSEQADNAAWVTTAVVTADAATAPDGNATADHIVATADSHLQTMTVTASAAYTCSVYLKAASAITVPVQCDDTTTNCSVGTSWTRCESRDASSSSTSINAGLGTGTYTVDWFGAQLEASAVATSYIPTTTATVTRAADALSWAFVAPSTGTVRYKVLCSETASWVATNRYFVTLSDGTGVNRIRSALAFSTTPNELWQQIVASNVEYASVVSGQTLRDGALHTIHQRWSSTNSDLFIDRIAKGTPDTSATIPTTTTLYFGNETGASPTGCLVSDLRVYSKQVLK